MPNQTLSVRSDFRLASQYDGLSDAEKENVRQQLATLDPADASLQIKIAPGGANMFIIPETGESFPTLTGVIVYTNKINACWDPRSSDGNSAPVCSSVDGKAGMHSSTRKLVDCKTCPYNQYGSYIDRYGHPGPGKACKNMRRLYLLTANNPNLYCLTVPPTSINHVNEQLNKLLPYTDKIVTLTLNRVQKGSNAYSTLKIQPVGQLTPQDAACTLDYFTRLDSAMTAAADGCFSQNTPRQGVPVQADNFDEGDPSVPWGNQPLPYSQSDPVNYPAQQTGYPAYPPQQPDQPPAQPVNQPSVQTHFDTLPPVQPWIPGHAAPSAVQQTDGFEDAPPRY